MYVCYIENDVPQEESEDEEEELPSAKLIKSTTECLAIINQQKVFLKRNTLPTEIVKQLETLVIGKQFALGNKQKEVTDYFKSSSETPKKKDVYRTVGFVSCDITIVDSLSDSTLDVDGMELDSINTMITSGAMNTVLRNEQLGVYTKMWLSRNKYPTDSTQKKLKLSGAAVRDKVMVMRDSDVGSLDTESDSHSLFSL